MDFLERAVEIATTSASGDGGPFGCVVVTSDGAVYEGRNEVVTRRDPTAHAEIQALRAAAAHHGHDLSGATLYSSARPCPMCFVAIHWANVERVEFAARSDQAAAAGFDDEWLARVTSGLEASPVQFRYRPLPSDNAPFEAWAANPNRVDY
ncbi:Guanine deaminase [Corynebacterium capitovis DSM 44611]|uniref:nucleoside deaminase n=1 Tax=Corynebacterium capitovis TaxID=131081 RepID=UPI00036BA7D9|nr:nucleoside deaminase [Corynebacterium capitovis]WKD57418.1 Guanine deaminase [Corynebacterium capitovis DSM 44611]